MEFLTIIIEILLGIITDEHDGI